MIPLRLTRKGLEYISSFLFLSKAIVWGILVFWCSITCTVVARPRSDVNYITATGNKIEMEIWIIKASSIKMHDWLKKRDFIITSQAGGTGKEIRFSEPRRLANGKYHGCILNVLLGTCFSGEKWVFSSFKCKWTIILPAKWSPEIYSHYFHIE